MSETAAFFHALRFLTILPAPQSDSLDTDWLVRASKYFPAVGIVVGGASAIVLLVASLFWAGFIPAILAVAASALVTGARLPVVGRCATDCAFKAGRSALL